MQILIVEDNDINAAVLTHFLIPYGHPVHRVVNGKQAVDYVLEHTVGLIMMDINMPIMDGHEATKQIRADTSIEQPPIIAVTADVTMASERKCNEVGMNGFLSKPLNAKRLATEVEQYLDKK
jgi:two-component system sensor histidine kinase/response regulator